MKLKRLNTETFKNLYMKHVHSDKYKRVETAKMNANNFPPDPQKHIKPSGIRPTASGFSKRRLQLQN